MSDNIAIRVENLTKVYKLYDTPADRLKEALHPLRRRFHHDFRALYDVSFEVKKGEHVGIIGKNGSGKSTLLKLITGVLTPTSGTVQVNGRVSALLELGAGFNSELNGIENIYFSGALMGFSREQMDEKLDDILSFADIAEFIHQPVKTYSSGMYVRLAFAVAINVSPDILIIDEALSVGDALFQQRCIAKIRAMRDSGVTLFFVSHAPDVIRALCTGGIWLENGEIKMINEAVKVSNAYQNEIFVENNRLRADLLLQPQTDKHAENLSSVNESLIKESTKDITTNKDVCVHNVCLKNGRGEIVNAYYQGEEFLVEIQLSAACFIQNLSIGILIKDRLGIDLTGESVFNKYRRGITLKPGEVATVVFRSKLLLSGGQNYAIGLSLDCVSKWDRSDHILLYRDDVAAVFKVIQDLENPMWFKFYQEFEVTVDVR